YRNRRVRASHRPQRPISEAKWQEIPFKPDDSAVSYAIFAWDFGLVPLHFVRRGVNYCNAVARAIVALLGRFLPRLGPLFVSGPFFDYSAAARYGRSSSSGISPKRLASFSRSVAKVPNVLERV